jgi:hypothetical protein
MLVPSSIGLVARLPASIQLRCPSGEWSGSAVWNSFARLSMRRGAFLADLRSAPPAAAYMHIVATSCEPREGL